MVFPVFHTLEKLHTGSLTKACSIKHRLSGKDYKLAYCLSDLGLVPTCLPRWALGVGWKCFSLPCDRLGQREQTPVLSHLSMNDGKLMRHTEVTATEQKHNVQLSAEHLYVTSNSEEHKNINNLIISLQV